MIGRTVKLKRAGREWVGLSPFGKEKTPSFYVNDEKGFFHDFSTGKHGDIISFLQETERLSFAEAVERLAGEAGIPLPAKDAAGAEADKKRQGLGEWMEEAAKFFEAQLRKDNSAAAGARDYLKRRGLSEADLKRFRLGFAPPGRTYLKDALSQKNAPVKDLVEAGLLIQPEGGGAPYDRFRERIMFPITDSRGRIISFGGRALNPDERAKYLNGPETVLFHKGRNLYGFFDALKLMGSGAEQKPLVVVEGYMDAIACQRAGLPGVAPLGTALTPEQMELLWRRTPEPVLWFDGDKAGLRAAYRSIDNALPLLKPGRSFRFVLMEGAKDPDELLREKGAEALFAALKTARPLVDILYQREEGLEALDTPERRAGFKQRLRAAAVQIKDRDLAEAYLEDLMDRFLDRFPKRGVEATSERGRANSASVQERWDDRAPEPRSRSAWEDEGAGSWRDEVPAYDADPYDGADLSGGDPSRDLGFEKPWVSDAGSMHPPYAPKKAVGKFSQKTGAQGRGFRGRFAPEPAFLPEGLAAAHALSRGLDPLVSAVVQGALADPERLEPHLETLDSWGFGDPVFAAVAKSIIGYRLLHESLDREGLTRHVTESGLRAFLSEISKAAPKAGAPFLAPEISLADARACWSKAFEVLTRMAALESAIASAQAGASVHFDAEAFVRLKGERDRLKRALKSGSLWNDGEDPLV